MNKTRGTLLLEFCDNLSLYLCENILEFSRFYLFGFLQLKLRFIMRFFFLRKTNTVVDVFWPREFDQTFLAAEISSENDAISNSDGVDVT